MLYIAAHPDDENTRLLGYLANERLVRTAYLSITRGDGGQNLIGAEQGPLLGLIRTQELLAARRVDGAEQFFTRARDFGFSKTPAETLAIWGQDAVLADVVWVIRSFQPDVIITRFNPDGSGTHGHHTASALLAVEAFRAAADPAFHPEQLKYVRPWQARRLLWNESLWGRKEGEDLQRASSSWIPAATTPSWASPTARWPRTAAACTRARASARHVAAAPTSNTSRRFRVTPLPATSSTASIRPGGG